MSFVFYVVEGYTLGSDKTFYFDSLEAATEFADFAGCSLRKYRPRARRSVHAAYANTIGTKGWLLQKGLDFWHDEPEEYPEFTDEDVGLPF